MNMSQQILKILKSTQTYVQLINFFLVTVVCTFIISSILSFEKNNKPIVNLENKAEEKDSRPISQVLSPGSKIITKNQIVLQAGDVCSWSIMENVAYGIYCKKSHLPKILLKETELSVEWVTTKRVLLPGLVNTVDGKDTTIFAKTSNGKEIYVVVVSGDNLKLVKKRNKINYSGSGRLSNVDELRKIFNLKIQ